MKPILLIAYRRLLGISTKEAAKRYGVAQRTFQCYESGSRRIPARIIEALYDDVLADEPRIKALLESSHGHR